MGEANRIIQLFQKRASNELPVSSSLTQVQEEELANQLFDVFESILTSTSYNQEDETTLDYNTSNDETYQSEEDFDTSSNDPDYEAKIQ